MKMVWILIGLFHATEVCALDTAARVAGAPARLLDKKSLRTNLGGVIPTPFSTATQRLNQPDLMRSTDPSPDVPVS